MWSVATVLVAATFASSLFAAMGSGARAVSGVASAAASGATSSTANGFGMENKMAGADKLSYGVDKLFRGASPGTGGQGSSDPRVEAAHIVANAWSTGTVPDTDRNYLAELVAARTGVSPADARARVDEFVAGVQDAVTKVKAEADAARKTAAKAAIFTALSMLVGAFIASVSAALGGRLRDEHR
jgi:hypothetical protein